MDLYLAGDNSANGNHFLPILKYIYKIQKE